MTPQLSLTSRPHERRQRDERKVRGTRGEAVHRRGVDGCLRRRHVRGARPLHGRRRRPRARRLPRGCGAGDRGCRSGVPRMVAERSRPAPGDLPQGRRHSRVAPGRDRRAARPRDGRQLRFRHVPDGLRAGPPAPGGRGGVLAPGADPRHRPPRNARNGHSQARRRRRRDRTLERGADSLGALDRGTAGARKHGRPEAVGALADRRRPRSGARSSARRAFPQAS